MCSIAGFINISKDNSINSKLVLNNLNEILAHRGPDGQDTWAHHSERVGFAHNRLSIIDLTKLASQPMKGNDQNVIVFNGEIYNYKELKSSLYKKWDFKTNSDTESILAAYQNYKENCLDYLNGMFAFALWDEKNKSLFCARDRFGIKPFYYSINKGIFYFASEAKALLPFLSDISTDENALAEYLTFQYTIGEKTLFKGIYQLLPGHALKIKNGKLKKWRYWDVNYDIDYSCKEKFVHKKLKELLEYSSKLHCRSDVQIGSYVSGGIDSSLIYKFLSKTNYKKTLAFHGRFKGLYGYDESSYAQDLVKQNNGLIKYIDIKPHHFKKYLSDIIYFLDFPTAGPGAFSQFMVSKLASEHVKVVLGGQGGDEIFGGYSRYIIAYLEQALKAAFDGNYKNGNYVVTIESIIPNLTTLKEYKPMIKQFWSKGLFDPMDERYFNLINRSMDMQEEVCWSDLNMEKVFIDFSKVFNNKNNVKKQAYFDKMTHYDFKCQLPALLHVEDRMSMAHGLESRVPFLEHNLVEFVAKIPADIKFKNGNLKYLLKKVFCDELPSTIINRRDKMGFPVPLKEWFGGPLKDFVNDTLSSMANKNRPFINSDKIRKNFGSENKFSRKTWALLSLELWYQRFHDRSSFWKNKMNRKKI